MRNPDSNYRYFIWNLSYANPNFLRTLGIALDYIGRDVMYDSDDGYYWAKSIYEVSSDNIQLNKKFIDAKVNVEYSLEDFIEMFPELVI